MWPGLFTSRVGAAERAWPAQEVVDQVEALRARPAIGGHIHFSAKALAEDRDGIATRLRQGAYAAPASVPVHPGAEPAGPWPVPRILVRRTGDGWALSLTAVSPPAGSAAGRVQVQPVAEAVGASATASAASAASTPSTPVPVVPTAPPSSQALAPVRQWAVWRRRGGSWTLQLQPGAQAHLDAEGAEALVVQAIVRGGQVGMPRAWWPGAPERDPA
jgi:hypothetical protein